MIYDTPITLLELPADAGTPLQGKLRQTGTGWCGEKEVYHSRYWESIQAGSGIDCMVELPLHRQTAAGCFVKYKSHIWEILHAQFGEDAQGLPITTLSLRRSERNYDVAEVRACAEKGHAKGL